MLIKLSTGGVKRSPLSKTAAKLARRFRPDIMFVFDGGLLFYQEKVVMYKGDNKRMIDAVFQAAAIFYDRAEKPQKGAKLFTLFIHHQEDAISVLQKYKRRFPDGRFILRQTQVRAFTPEEILGLNPRHKAHKEPHRKFSVSSFFVSRELLCKV